MSLAYGLDLDHFWFRVVGLFKDWLSGFASIGARLFIHQECEWMDLPAESHPKRFLWLKGPSWAQCSAESAARRELSIAAN